MRLVSMRNYFCEAAIVLGMRNNVIYGIGNLLWMCLVFVRVCVCKDDGRRQLRKKGSRHNAQQ